MPQVSVIIPFHNRIKWVSEAVQSVLDQTYHDFEIILVDDGSTEPLLPYLEIHDPRIKYIRQDNKGPSSARNHGINLSKGTFIAFLDSDDLFLPTKLERQIELMKKNPDVLFSHTSYERINTEGSFIEKVESGLFSGIVYPEPILSTCPIATPTVMIHREALKSDIRFDESLQIEVVINNSVE